MNLDTLKKDNSKEVTLKVKRLVKNQERSNSLPIPREESMHSYSFNEEQSDYNKLQDEAYQRSCANCRHVDFAHEYCEETGQIIWNLHLDAFNCQYYKEPS